MTSYGIIVNNAEQLATTESGHEFTWVRLDNDLTACYAAQQ